MQTIELGISSLVLLSRSRYAVDEGRVAVPMVRHMAPQPLYFLCILDCELLHRLLNRFG